MPAVNILTDDTKNKILIENGYVVIPFLSSEEVKSLTKYFYSYHKNLPNGMYASSHASDFNLRKKMNEQIKITCKRALGQSLKNAIRLGATFMVKTQGETGSLHPHQDWNIVNEKEFNSFNIWIPLVDVSEENGTIQILPDSHKFSDNIRGLNIPSSFESVEKDIWQYLVPVNMKAGEALIYNHRLLHASGINHTNTPRLVIVYGIIPSGAEMFYYYGRQNQIEVYECTPEFYFNESITDGPNGLHLLSSFQNNNPIFDTTIISKRTPNTLSLFQNIFKFFKKKDL